MSPRHWAAASTLRICYFNCRAGQSHKDNVRCTAVEEQPEAKEVQLPQPSSTSLLMISSGLTSGSSPPPSSCSRLEPCCVSVRNKMEAMALCTDPGKHPVSRAPKVWRALCGFFTRRASRGSNAWLTAG